MSMRAVKTAIAQALATDEAVAELVPAPQVFATERAVLPLLPFRRDRGHRLNPARRRAVSPSSDLDRGHGARPVRR